MLFKFRIPTLRKSRAAKVAISGLVKTNNGNTGLARLDIVFRVIGDHGCSHCGSIKSSDRDLKVQAPFVDPVALDL
jgi:hypothetical protein